MIIWNVIDIPKDELVDRFNNGKTLSDLAEYYRCSQVTIKRKLRSAGINTSRYNHSDIAKIKHRKKVCAKSDVLTKKYLVDEYINKNFDTKSIAEKIGVHYSTVRKYVQQFGLIKSNDQLVGAWQSRYLEKHGYVHPSQHTNKYSRSVNKVKFQMLNGPIIYLKSIMELTYTLYLDQAGVNWTYESERIKYVDHISGKQRTYTIDFTLKDEWVEVKPSYVVMPTDKRLYAEREAEKRGKKFRLISDVERIKGWELLLNGYAKERYEFIRARPRTDIKQVTYYFKSYDELKNYTIDGFKYLYSKCLAPTLYKLVLRKLYVN
jgi:hypothetical protein